jgi:putative transposase
MHRTVWIPKYRRRTLVGQVAERLKQTVEESAAEREKGVSARILLKEFPDLAQRPGRGVLWAPSYFIARSGHCVCGDDRTLHQRAN